jgi:hypothetical protein
MGEDLSPLLETIDASQLPVEYGGTYSGPFLPMCGLTNEQLRLEMGFKCFHMAARESEIFEYDTSGKGYVCWTWHTEARTIDFSVK